MTDFAAMRAAERQDLFRWAIAVFAGDRECAAAIGQFLERRREALQRAGVNVGDLVSRLPSHENPALDRQGYPFRAVVWAGGQDIDPAMVAVGVGVNDIRGDAPIMLGHPCGPFGLNTSEDRRGLPGVNVPDTS